MKYPYKCIIPLCSSSGCVWSRLEKGVPWSMLSAKELLTARISKHGKIHMIEGINPYTGWREKTHQKGALPWYTFIEIAFEFVAI